MATQGRALTTWEAACTITGYSVGSGITALPYLMEHAGFVPGIVILVVAFFFSYCMHMRIASGLVAILIALSVPFMAVRAEKMNGGLFLIKPWMASKPMLALLVVAFIGMAVGSMIPA